MPEFIEQVKPTGPEKVPHGESGHRISAGSCPDPPLALTLAFLQPSSLPDPSTTLSYLQFPKYVTISCVHAFAKTVFLTKKKKPFPPPSKPCPPGKLLGIP